jgi:hypothetical protein
MRNPEPSTTQGQHRTQKYLVCFCPECWRFQDFRRNQDDVRDWTFMKETISRVEKIGQSHYSKGLKDPVTGLDMQKVVDYYLKYNMAPDPDTFDPVIVPQSAKCLNSKMVKHCALTNVNSDRGFESRPG